MEVERSGEYAEGLIKLVGRQLVKIHVGQCSEGNGSQSFEAVAQKDTSLRQI